MSAPEQFAKLFATPDGHQVLVLKDDSDDGRDLPVIRVTCEHRGLRLTTTLTFANPEKGSANRNDAFDRIGQAAAARFREKLVQQLTSMVQPRLV